MTVSSENLAEAASKGDVSAFSELYSLIYKDMYYYALSRLCNPEDAEDAVSETIIDAFSGISGLKYPSRFKSWIFKILTRHISAMYSKRRKIIVSDNEHNDGEPLIEPDLSGIEVLEAFELLSKKERTVISLSAMAGMTSEDISKITGMKASTVRSHLLRARKKLKLTYEEKETC